MSDSNLSFWRFYVARMQLADQQSRLSLTLLSARTAYYNQYTPENWEYLRQIEVQMAKLEYQQEVMDKTQHRKSSWWDDLMIRVYHWTRG